MAMTLAQVHGALDADGRHERDALRLEIYAARVAQASNEDYQRALKEIG